jgi:hypothetical protein
MFRLRFGLQVGFMGENPTSAIYTLGDWVIGETGLFLT